MHFPLDRLIYRVDDPGRCTFQLIFLASGRCSSRRTSYGPLSVMTYAGLDIDSLSILDALPLFGTLLTWLSSSHSALLESSVRREARKSVGSIIHSVR